MLIAIAIWDQTRYRPKASDSENYLFEWMRYIDLNPVRAGMVAHPRDYPWSSYRADAEGRADPLHRPHALYRSLAEDERECRAMPLPKGRKKGTDAA